jgi:hypothetical protein
VSDDAVIADTMKDVADQSGGMVDDITDTMSSTYQTTADKTLGVVSKTVETDGTKAGEISAIKAGGDPVPNPSSKVAGILNPGRTASGGGHQIAMFGDGATGDVTTDPDGAVFWSGSTKIGADDPAPWPEAETKVYDGQRVVTAGENNAKAIARGMDKTSLEGLMEDRGITLPQWDPDDPAVVQQWKDISDRYAQGVSGNVHVVLGQDMRPGNVWETVELPRLLANPNVTSITKINLTTLQKTTIFTRGA